MILDNVLARLLETVDQNKHVDQKSINVPRLTRGASHGRFGLGNNEPSRGRNPLLFIQML